MSATLWQDYVNFCDFPAYLFFCISVKYCCIKFFVCCTGEAVVSSLEHVIQRENSCGIYEMHTIHY